MEITLAVAEVLEAYGFTEEDVQISQIGNGLINHTYLLKPVNGSKKFILQQINKEVFQDPIAISNNWAAIADYISENSPDYFFISPIPTKSGNLLATVDDEFWRLIPFVEHTVSLDFLEHPKQAYEAAMQFGKLSRLLNGFDPSQLTPTIPNFHNLPFRFNQFKDALSGTSAVLKEEAKKEISEALYYHYLVDYYKSYLGRDDFHDRVMHHDTKISNVLLDEKTFKGVCVIDLDTMMPGKTLSDLGDMMRTYLCAYSENETDLDKVNIRMEYFEAMIKGYFFEMKDIFTGTEKELILFSGKYIIYMQALRFLTDFLNGDVYYPIKYPNQNLDRTKNQLKLLKELYANEEEMQHIIDVNLN